jgi:hypothetical protein
MRLMKIVLTATVDSQDWTDERLEQVCDGIEGLEHDLLAVASTRLKSVLTPGEAARVTMTVEP